MQTIVADSLVRPVSFALAPDGRAFVCEQDGRVRVVKNGRRLRRPFVTLPTIATGEQGLLGIALDPAFARNRHVFLCLTVADGGRHNRVVRVTASGDTARAGSLRTIFDLDPHLGVTHLGGRLRFGRDGMLYAATGEDGAGENSQSLRSTSGKLLRLRPDGSIPDDNPFVRLAEGPRRAIWARGFRNAFGFDLDGRTGRVYVNDVGDHQFEEVNDVVAGGNYGAPMFEGPRHFESFRVPIHHYGRDRGCAITGGAFYRPAVASFGDRWRGRYLFADYCAGEVRWLDPAAPERASPWLRTRIPGPLDLAVARDGSVWYLARGTVDPTGGGAAVRGALVRVTPPRRR